MKRFTMIFALVFVTFSFGFGQVEELIYDDDDNSDWQGIITEHAFAARMSPSGPCEVLMLKYYVDKQGASEGGFTALIFDWDTDQPAATADYEQIGVVITEQWKEHEVVGDLITYDGDFVVGFLIHDPAAFLGYDGEVETDRYWNYDVTNQIWTEETSKAYFIRAVVQVTATGLIEELEGTMINVYPNPASDVLNINAENGVKQVTLINPVGQVVYDAVLEANKTSIDLSEFTVGVYMVQLKKADGTVLSTQKVVIK
jgi:hypothetical protein